MVEGQVGLDAVYDFLTSIRAPIDADDSQPASFFFTGYLVFDALIQNVDRHHQNWGVIRGPESRRLAPSYDHGACLGRELGDRKRENYLRNKQIEAYVSNKKGRAKIAPPGTVDRVSPIDLIEYLPQLGQREACLHWINNAVQIECDQIASLFKRVPNTVAGPSAVKFAIELLRNSRERLLEIREELTDE